MAVVESTISASGGGDYTSIGAWEAATNLNGGADIWKGTIVDGSAYDEAVTINGGGTSVNSYVWLTVDAANRHAGVWDTTKARIAYTGTATAAIEIDSDWVRVDWLQILRTGAGFGASDEGIRVRESTDVLLDYLIIWADVLDDGTDGIYTGNWAITRLSISNSVIYGWDRGGIHLQQFGSSAINQDLRIDHCAVGASGRGDGSGEGCLHVRQSGGTTTVDVHNSWFGGRPNDPPAADPRDIVLRASGSAAAFVDVIGSHNVYHNWVFIDSSGATAQLTWTDSIITNVFEGLTDVAPTVTAVYINQHFPLTGFDATLVDDPLNMPILNGTNRIGSEPDPRQDFSVSINGTRPTSNVDVGPFQISPAAPPVGGPLVQVDYSAGFVLVPIFVDYGAGFAAPSTITYY